MSNKIKVQIGKTKQQINNMVIAKIREKYSINDEFQMQRKGLSDSTDIEYQAYIAYVEECTAWGTSEKQKYELI